MGRGYKIAPTLLSEKSGKQNDRYSEKLDVAGGIIHKDDILGFALQESQIIKNEYSVLRVPLIRDRIPSVAQSVPLTY